MASAQRKYGKITGLETLGLLWVGLCLPLRTGFRLLCKPFVATDRVRSWRRVKAEGSLGYAVTALNSYQVQFLNGTTGKVYEKWARSKKVPIDVEKIDGDANLLWVTPRWRNHVIVYVHGGGDMLPATPFGLSFWKQVMDFVNKEDEQVSLAILEYTLFPTANFPIPLKQTVACIKNLMDSGYKPKDIFLVGDSSGASLILQAISHILHPFAGVPELSLPSTLGGLILVSPYVTFDSTAPSFGENAKKDLFPESFYKQYGVFMSPLLPDESIPYVQAEKAPKGWFQGSEKVVSRVLITTGNYECLHSCIDNFAKEFCARHNKAELVDIPAGTHNEPYGTFLAGDPNIGEWPSRMANWLAKGMTD